MSDLKWESPGQKQQQGWDIQKACALCDRELETPEEKSIGLCSGHALVMSHDLEFVTQVVNLCQPKANAAKDPDEKIKYYKMILDALYKIKIVYYDHGIRPLTQDIDELIDQTIHFISTARL